MLRESFSLDGVDANSVGIRLQSPVSFDAPEPIVDIQRIEGRNGDVIYETGAYSNRDGVAKCYALGTNVRSTISSVNKYLFATGHGYRRLETTDDPDHYYKARIANGAQLEQRLRLLNPFEIEFDCMPQAFRKDGENQIVISEQTTVNNPGMPSKPIIVVEGSGAGVIYIGDYTVQILSLPNGTITLDCETYNAYNTNGNQNSSINAKAFPVLSSGNNSIRFTGDISRLLITPRWWDL